MAQTPVAGTPESGASAMGSPRTPHAMAYATRSVPVASPEMTAAEVRTALAVEGFEALPGVAVCDGPRLVGVASLASLFGAEADERIAGFMDPHPPMVHPGLDEERAAWTAVAHGREYVAVVGRDGEFEGLIPAHRMLQVLLEERNEDLARRAGETAVERARTAVVEPMARRIRHRLPWLLVGVGGAMAAAGVVGAFEADLKQRVILAYFLPAIVYIAGAVGMQTETLLIRAMSAGVAVRDLVRGESMTGIVIGVVLAAVAFLIALVGWGDAEVALTLGIGIVAASAVATMLALALPVALVRLGFDPAFGSGPIATVVQDVTTVAIYLSVARLILS